MPHYVSVIVDGGNSFREKANLESKLRINMLCSLIKHMKKHEKSKSIKTIVFPAGYLCRKSKKAVDNLASTVCDRIASLKCPFKIVLGIDLYSENSKTSKSEIPFYVFAFIPGKTKPHKIQQISATAKDGRDSTIENKWKNRNLCIPKSREALLVCGESWSTILLQKVKDAKAKILFVPAHQSVKLHRKPDNGFSRLSWHLNFQKFYKESGIPVILTEHTKTPHRHKYAWPSNRTKEVKLPHELSKLFISVYLTEI